MIQKSVILKLIVIGLTTISTLKSSQETKQDRATRIGILKRKAIAQAMFEEYNKYNNPPIFSEKLSIDNKKEIDIILELFNTNQLLMEEQIDARLPLGTIEFRRALYGWELNIYQHLITRQSKW